MNICVGVKNRPLICCWEPRVEIDELSRLVMQEVSALASA